MLGSSIPVENMSHLVNSFAVRGDGKNDAIKYVDKDTEGLHPTQINKKRIKLQLLFVIPDLEREDDLPESQKSDLLPRVACVRVPRGLPVAKLYPLCRHIEAQLQDIYGRAMRLNIAMVCDEDSEDWKFVHDLPTYGVVYV